MKNLCGRNLEQDRPDGQMGEGRGRRIDVKASSRCDHKHPIMGLVASTSHVVHTGELGRDVTEATER